MSKTLIDTNVWVDVVLNRPRYVTDSKGAIMACIEEGDEMFIPATSLKDVFYFASRSAGPNAGYRAVELIMDIATPAQVDSIVCKNAAGLERPDYEKGIIAACVQAESIDVIITRDKKSFDDLGVLKYSPREYLEAHGFESVPY